MNTETPSTEEKVLRLNLDKSKYGTFAEIGAGQEVANWFFRVSATAGTVAKAMSAYDMKFSDSIYGECSRYVSRQRLLQMLEGEYKIIEERLSEERGADSTFFVFANTVRAKSYRGRGEWHGWLGVRLQLEPQGEPHDILIHVRLLDGNNLQQMEALGIVGVNLIYAAFYHRDDVPGFVTSLSDGLGGDRLEVDMLKFEGPGFADIDNRWCSLLLVEKELTDAALFDPDGEVKQPAEQLYGKSILVMRGSFNPVTRVNVDMLESARGKFVPQLEDKNKVIEIMECTMDNLLHADGSEAGKHDFLHRADCMQALGRTVLVTRYKEFHRLASFFRRYTPKPVGLVMGLTLMEQIFDEKWYEELPGGILEAMGRLFKNDVQLLVYPSWPRRAKNKRTVDDARLDKHLKHLFAYVRENGLVQDIPSITDDILEYTASDVRTMQSHDDERWKTLVPREIIPLLES